MHNGYLCTSPSAPIYEAGKMSVAGSGFPRQNLFSAGEKWVEQPVLTIKDFLVDEQLYFVRLAARFIAL